MKTSIINLKVLTAKFISIKTKEIQWMLPMKKIIILFFLIISSSIHANQLYITSHLGISSYDTFRIKIENQKYYSEFHIEPPITYNLGLGYQFYKDLFMELLYEYQFLEKTDQSIQEIFIESKLETMSLAFLLVYKYSYYKIKPILGVGLGISQNALKDINILQWEQKTSKIDGNINYQLMWQFKFGLAWPIFNTL